MGASALSYGAGFLTATALLHGVGIGAALAARSHSQRLFARGAGLALAMVGLIMLVVPR